MIRIPAGVTRAAGRALLQTQKHSPTILFAAGVTGVVGTVVLACKATLKVDDVLNDMEKEKALLDQHQGLVTKGGDFVYSEVDLKKDKAFFYTRSALEIGKLYAPAIIVGTASVACLTGSHRILTQRNSAITAAYIVLEKAHDQYRSRVVDELGFEKDAEFNFGVEEHDEKVVDKHGKVKTVKVKSHAGASGYAVFFDENSPRWQRQWDYNQIFLQVQQSYATDKLRMKGHLFLNEVYDMLGVPRTPAGQAVGWLWKKDGPGDGFVDFGIFRDGERGQEFVNGNEKSILLDFNVDGPIWDLI